MEEYQVGEKLKGTSREDQKQYWGFYVRKNEDGSFVLKTSKDVEWVATEVKRKKPAYKSRAARISEACQSIVAIADRLREIKEDFEGQEFSDDNEKEEKQKELITEAQGEVESIETGEIESVQEELENWRDGMSGTNLENTDKYSELEEAIDSISNAVGGFAICFQH